MSLVSYVDSDDSGEEDISEPRVQKNVERNTDKGVKLGPTDSQTKAPVEQNKPQENVDDSGHDKTKPKSIGGLFSSLPAPWMSTISWANKSSGKMPKGKEQTVKITLPSLADNSDSDDEDFVRKDKTPATDSQKPPGLFSLLPKPKHSVVVKENNPNRPVIKISNRPLIPDSLRRKQVKKPTPQVKKPTPQVKKPTTQAQKADSDDDSDDDDGDDDDGGSFFSWNENETSATQDASTSQVASDAGSTVSSDQVGERNIDVTQSQTTENILPSMTTTSSNETYKIPSSLSDKIPSSSSDKIPSSLSDKIPSSLPGNTQETKNTKNIQTFVQAAPVSNIDTDKHLDYLENQNSSTDTNTQGYSYQGTSNPTEYSAGYQTNSENVGYAEPNYPYYDYYNSEQYNQAATSQEQTHPEWQSPAPPAVEETPEQFKRFLGKRGRGEENIDIIDVNADDQVGPSQDWKSNYQKEDIEYKPQSKKKDNLPSSQQRRKHQISYLAFQAKEQEWALRNQWSANRQTKRQTQSKYGF